MLRITKAAMTPGTHAHSVSMSTIKKDPQPLSTTDKGGNIIARITLRRFMTAFTTNNPSKTHFVSAKRQTKADFR